MMTNPLLVQETMTTEPQLLEALPAQHKIAAIVIAAVMLLVVVELVRKRKLREEYSVIWALTAVLLMALALEPRLLTLFQQAIGAVLATNALFLGALIFLMLVALHFSVHLSKLTFRVKALSQKMALLEKDLENMEKANRGLGDQKIHELHPSPQTGKAKRATEEEATG
ncbi:MAG: DUF2304 domain-containing protein [Planctomycetota bacterium]|jgi:hypothetical protein